jgi:pSer/pThr/pTyr-binding forkhead associated (FHA) protein
MALLLRASKVADGKAEIIINSGQIIIGRLPSSNLVLAGAEVEPIHAMIEFAENGDANLMDMGSETGVKLNGNTIEVLQTIKPGDWFEIGGVRIDVLDPVEVMKAVQAARPPPPKPPPLPPAPPVAATKHGAAETKPIVDAKAAAAKEENKDEKDSLRETMIAEMPSAKNGRADGMAFKKEHKSSDTTAEIDAGMLFRPGKERPSGAVVEVVAFWGSNILDVRHYGGESAPGDAPRSKDIRIGNEEDGHIIGVGPSSDTRNHLLATVSGTRTTVHLDKDMKGRFRRGGRFEKVQCPIAVSIDNN